MPLRTRLQTPHLVAVGLGLVCALSAKAHGEQPIQDGPLQSFFDGLSHPTTGLNHFLAMFSVGVLSLLLGRRQLLQRPAVFLAGMAAGSAAGQLMARADASVPLNAGRPTPHSPKASL